MKYNKEQQALLDLIARRIPELLSAMEDGNYSCEATLGRRRIHGKIVELKLTARWAHGEMPEHIKKGAGIKFDE